MTASLALDLAQRHRTPPFPRTYEVWFTYASGQNAALVERIDQTTMNGGDVSAAMIEELYNAYLSPDVRNAGVERIGDRVQTELGEVIDLIEGGSEGAEKLAAAIATAEQALAKSKDPASQAQAVDRLREEQRRHQRAATRLGENLGAMRAQFLAMQQELRELRQTVLLDPVTQLPNANFYADAAARLIDEGMLGEGGEPVSCLILLDVDTLSEIRRACGRRAAEAVLGEAASLLRRVLQDGDVAIRLDSDRFAMLLRERDKDVLPRLVYGLEQAMAAIQLRSAATPNAFASVIATAGLATLAPRDTPAALLERAEQSQARERAARATPAAE
ncbi:MAG: GGDEF domain-containing protein [Pseudomonadota bacterium]